MKINDTACLYALKVKKSQKRHSARLRSNRKLHQYQLHPKAEPANMKTHPGKKTLQCQWNPKQSRNLEVLHRHHYQNRNKAHASALLPYWPRRQPSYTRIPIVCQRATTNQLGEGLDRLLAIAHCSVNRWHRKSNICYLSQGKKSDHQTSQSRRVNPSPIQDIHWCLQWPRIKEVPTKMTLGPQDQTETWSTNNTDQQNHQTIDNGIRRTQEICWRTSRMRNHPMIQEPLRCVLLLHQEKEQQIKTYTRLPTN